MIPSRTATLMAQEINEIPDVLARQIEEGLDLYREAGRRAAASNPRGFVTCARGTSDHAATFLKYVIETRTGLPVASIGPSIASIYNTKLRLEGFVSIAISQSGGSPDIAALQEAARQGGAYTIAMLNEIASPVGNGAETLLPILAGPERCVAATKSFVSSLFAILGFVAGFTGDSRLDVNLREFPDCARRALECDWSPAKLALARAASVFMVGRGPNLAISAEAALKLKETCRIHAEVFSAAEMLHGPIILADRKFAAFLFDPEDQSQTSVDEAGAAMQNKGASIFSISSKKKTGNLLLVPAVDNQLLLPLVQIIAFYKFAEILARDLGENADSPDGLSKVTATI